MRLTCHNSIIAQHDGDHTADRYFYLHDRLGSVRQLIDTSGNVKNLYTYKPFGELYPAPDFEETIENPFKFTGQFYDSEIDQYYLRARQYDPHIARFTARDPIFGDFEEPLTMHVYLYCLNNPVDYVDPSGEILETPIAVSEGATMYASDLVIGGLGLSAAYALLIQNELYQAAIGSIVTGVTHEVDRMVDFGFDVLAAASGKMAKKKIAGALGVINEHLARISTQIAEGGPDDPIKDWLKHIQKHLRNIRKAAKRLKGNQRDDTLKLTDDLFKQLEELARQHNLPWGS
jgi:RHS repeat-associated protein